MAPPVVRKTAGEGDHRVSPPLPWRPGNAPETIPTDGYRSRSAVGFSPDAMTRLGRLAGERIAMTASVVASTATRSFPISRGAQKVASGLLVPVAWKARGAMTPAVSRSQGTTDQSAQLRPTRSGPFALAQPKTSSGQAHGGPAHGVDDQGNDQVLREFLGTLVELMVRRRDRLRAAHARGQADQDARDGGHPAAPGPTHATDHRPDPSARPRIPPKTPLASAAFLRPASPSRWDVGCSS